MYDGPDIVVIASLIGDRARADMLTALMTDQALTATELAAIAAVTKPTASAHLAKLLEAGLVRVEPLGRHRYFRLADRDVAALLENLMGVAFRTGAVRLRSSPREPALRKARVCYDHLAGDLGVLVFDRLEAHGHVRRDGEALVLTEAGRAAFVDFGIDPGAITTSRRPLLRACLDWSGRRHHLAGGLGAALLDQCLAHGWARRVPDSRIVTFSPTGERALELSFPA
ncbi:MAG: ArsR/SmtB family transcription factor [Candidatus Limnocylindrales bacterium]